MSVSAHAFCPFAQLALNLQVVLQPKLVGYVQSSSNLKVPTLSRRFMCRKSHRADLLSCSKKTEFRKGLELICAAIQLGPPLSFVESQSSILLSSRNATSFLSLLTVSGCSPCSILSASIAAMSLERPMRSKKLRSTSWRSFMLRARLRPASVSAIPRYGVWTRYPCR